VDGISDGGDNCALDANFDQADVEGDDIGDLCDVCPDAYGLDQSDRDGDGYGDLCDVCPGVADVNAVALDCNDDGDSTDVGEGAGEQCDSDLNGVGDACEPLQLLLRPVSFSPGLGGALSEEAPSMLSSTASSSQALYELWVSCPFVGIKRVTFGVKLPAGTAFSSLDFGLGCNATSCSSAAGLGTTVDRSLSFSSPITGPGIPSDVLFFTLEGNPLLCQSLETVRLATLSIAGTLDLVGDAPQLTPEGLSRLGVPVAVDESNAAVGTDEVWVSFGGLDPVVSLSLERASSDVDQTTWALKMDADGLVERATLGVIGFQGIATNNLLLLGCEGAPDAEGRRICTGTSDPTALGPRVDLSRSFSYGPATPGLVRPDTLYVSVSAAPGQALNAPGFPVLLGTLRFPSAAPPDRPTLTFQGVTSVPGVTSALLALGGGAIDPSGARLVGSYNQADDTDLDGRSDDVDNCPFVANSDQLDRGKLASLLPDGIGDLCQCGESTGDGSIFAPDVMLLRQLLAGQGVSQPLLVHGRCSVQGTPGCDVADVALLRRALSNLTPAPRPACEYAVP
jgi:hypothetical protein